MATSVVQQAPPSALVRFDIAYEQLMQRWEDPHYSGKVTTDGGGTTKYGISRNAYPTLDIANLTLSRAKEIAHADYWMYSKWDISYLERPYQSLANKLFQFGFNEGVGTVIQATNMCLYIAGQLPEIPKLGDPLVISNKAEVICMGLTEMLASAQLARYTVKYHGLSRVPHSLLDRALCIE